MTDVSTSGQDELRQHLSERYARLIVAVSTLYPLVGSVLWRAHENRIQNLSSQNARERIAGIEELLVYLESCAEVARKHTHLLPIAFLIDRARGDFDTAIEAALTGMQSAVFDAMRDVMEIGLLLEDFAHDADRISLWLAGESKNKFLPVKLRERKAKRLGLGSVQELPDSIDYKGHSETLHVIPRRSIFSEKGVLAPQVGSDSVYWEMYFHGRELAATLLELFEAAGVVFSCSFDPKKVLSRFVTVSDQLREDENEFWKQVREQQGESDTTPI
jgi:hypothetical protein